MGHALYRQHPETLDEEIDAYLNENGAAGLDAIHAHIDGALDEIDRLRASFGLDPQPKPSRKGEQAPCGVDVLRDLFTERSDGSRPWKAEYPNVTSLGDGRALADRIAEAGNYAAHVWQDGDIVYKAYSPAAKAILGDDER